MVLGLNVVIVGRVAGVAVELLVDGVVISLIGVLVVSLLNGFVVEFSGGGKLFDVWVCGVVILFGN